MKFYAVSGTGAPWYYSSEECSYPHKPCVVCDQPGRYWCMDYCKGSLCYDHFIVTGRDVSCTRCREELREGP